MSEQPSLVRGAHAAALESGFEYSCDDSVGHLLAVLAAAVPRGGRILELGTGAGVGTAWIVHGLKDRLDVAVVTIERDPAVAVVAQSQAWPGCVEFVVGDAVELLPSVGHFDLVFADAQGGKWERLDLSIDSLTVGGLLLVDDMTPRSGWTADQAITQSNVRSALLVHPSLVACELDWATGVILCARAGEP